MISRNQRTIIDLSLRILRAALAQSRESTVDNDAVRLALRCLLPHCPENWPLTSFWESASQENEIGRGQGLTAGFNGICRQLRAAGRYPE